MLEDVVKYCSQLQIYLFSFVLSTLFVKFNYITNDYCLNLFQHRIDKFPEHLKPPAAVSGTDLSSEPSPDQLDTDLLEPSPASSPLTSSSETDSQNSENAPDNKL